MLVDIYIKGSKNYRRGIIIIAFLFLVVGKKKIQLKLDKFILPLFILCVIGVVYVFYVEYNIGLLERGIMMYDANEEESVSLALSLALKMAGVSTVIYTIFYIAFWWEMRRITTE